MAVVPFTVVGSVACIVVAFMPTDNGSGGELLNNFIYYFETAGRC